MTKDLQDHTYLWAHHYVLHGSTCLALPMTKDLQDHTFTAFIMNEDLLQCMLNFLEIEMHEPYLLDYGYYCCSTKPKYNLWIQTNGLQSTSQQQLYCNFVSLHKKCMNQETILKPAFHMHYWMNHSVHYHALAHAGIMIWVTKMVLQHVWQQDS